MPAMEYPEDARSFETTEASGRELGGPSETIQSCIKTRKVGCEAIATYKFMYGVLKRRTFVTLEC